MIFRLQQILGSPFSHGNAFIVSEGGPCDVNLWVRLTCYLSGLELFTITPSEIAYEEKRSVEHIKAEMVQFFITCGIKVMK